MSAFLSNLEFVFGWLLAASWQASVLALAVIVLQAIFGARLNPRWRYALWLLVVLRLVLPVLPESALSLFQFAPPPPAALTVTVTEPLFVAAPLPPPVNVPAAVSRPVHALSFYSLLAIVWLAGALGLLTLTLIVNRRFAQQVAHSPEITDPELLRLFSEAKAEFRIRRPIRLIENSQVQSPAIMGLFHPALLLPVNVRDNFDPRELRFIFLHELAHLKRGDILIQALIAVLQILHWFNPVLWFAFRRMRIDREPATDALVLSRTGEDEKERYGLMLIKLLEHFNQRHSLATLVGILEEKDQFKRRFGLIARFTRGAYGWSILGVAMLGALAVAGLTQAERATFHRDPTLPLVLDLKPWYSRVFTDPAGTDSKYKGFAGRKAFDGLPFDLGGQIELWGKEAADRGTSYSDAAVGIKIDRKFDELHLIHATDWREYDGCPVATIRLQYADGTSADLTIRYNQQVNAWSRLYTEDAELIDDPGTKIIWRGQGAAEGVGRLFKSVLNNPFPNKKVDAMNVTSARSGCSYMLVAATVAQREPGREVTPTMPLLPPRNFDGQLKLHIVDKKTGAPIAGAEIYPGMVIGDISLVADNVLAGDDGSAVVKYPVAGTKNLMIKVVHAGYKDCAIHWNNGWNAGEIPGEITYRLTREGDTAVDHSVPDFSVDSLPHPAISTAAKQGNAAVDQEGTGATSNDDPLIYVADTELEFKVDPKDPKQAGEFQAVLRSATDQGLNEALQKTHGFRMLGTGPEARFHLSALAPPQDPEARKVFRTYTQFHLGEDAVDSKMNLHWVDSSHVQITCRLELRDAKGVSAHPFSATWIQPIGKDGILLLAKNGLTLLAPQSDGSQIGCILRFVAKANPQAGTSLLAASDEMKDVEFPPSTPETERENRLNNPPMLDAVNQAGTAPVGINPGTQAQLVLALHDRAKSIPPTQEHLQILQAFCGADGSWRDVTGFLQKSVQNNSLKISWEQPYAEIGGDPAYLQVKTLVVSYRLDGVEKLDTFHEENFPVGLQATLPVPDSTAEKVDAAKPGDATVSGQLTIPVAAHPDFAKSVGVLVSDEGAQYPLAFDNTGRFVVTGVVPGRYRIDVHVVCEPRDVVVGVDKTFGFTGVTAGSHPVMNFSWDPTPPAKGGIEIGMKIVQIDEDVYQANKVKIDAGVEKGGVEIMGLLNQMKGVSLLSSPSVTTKPGLKANIDIVREMPYPTCFENPKMTAFVAGSASSQTNMAAYIPPTPMEFQTKDIGVMAEITPSLIGKTLSPQGAVIPDRIMVSGKFTVAEFEGFTQSNIVATATPTFNTSESHFIEALADGELKGVWIPGSHYRTADALNKLPGVATDPNAPTIKTRYLLFLSARKVD